MRPGSAPARGRSTISGGYTEQMAAFHVTAAPLDVEAVAGLVTRDSDGAVATFVGLVRDHNAGRAVRWLDYEAFAPLAVKTFEQIGAEAAAQWPDTRLAIHHRTGRVAIGEASVAIAAASPHRGHAFAACRYAIERVKQIAPIWKHEHFEGGEVWIEGATADPMDEEVRRMAFAQCS